MKRLNIAFILVCILSVCYTNVSGQIYVSPIGNDKDPGTELKPKVTLEAALRQLREKKRLGTIKNEDRIILRGGTYFLNAPVLVRPEDGGTPMQPTRIEAAPGEIPVLNGGIAITDWKKSSQPIKNLPRAVANKIWEAKLPMVAGRSLEFRQLWINGKKAVCAKSTRGNQMHRILNWNKEEAAAVIPALSFINLEEAPRLEFFIHQWWEIANLRVRKIQQRGDSAWLYFQEQERRIQNEHPWPAPWLSSETGNSAFYLANAIQFLDEPGEWYLDVAAQKLYYYPMTGEDMTTAVVIAPVQETLLEIKGTPDKPVANFLIKGITFEYSSWLRPSLQGHVPHQLGMYMTEAYKLKPAGTPEKPTLDNQAWVGRPAAAVRVNYARDIGIENNRFLHMASTALDLQRAIHKATVQGNLFKDIGGTAILGGYFSDNGDEVHIPYNTRLAAELCDELHIKNNLVTNAANEDWGCAGIGMGYVKNIVIEKNEIENVSYSGISVGWGWTPKPNIMQNNRVLANKIHYYGKHNYDCAGIYTLSAQPGSVIANNYIDSIYKAPYAHLPTHWFYLYTDEGSSGITVKDNWTPSQKYLQNNNGTGNRWINNGPQVSNAIQQAAGIENRHAGLLTEKTGWDTSFEINKERNELVELVTNKTGAIDLLQLKNFLAQNSIDHSALYQWNNHFVIYGKIQDAVVFKNRVEKQFPQAQVKLYQNLVYEFDKSQRCTNKTVAKEWEPIILTANLVADKKKQEEYLNYHATQFEKWPEVSRGFCNAGFQQLLVFKNERQLMLVISIPKGKTLEELNPKTTEHNPRVEEWNRIMSGFQEGIKGARKGETWVFLEKVE